MSMKAAYYNYLMALKLYVSSGMPFYFLKSTN